MTRQIQIPDHLLFDGNIPPSRQRGFGPAERLADNTLPEWKRKRLGKITASCFGLVKKLKTTGQWGDTALSYLYDLVGEHITGEPSGDFHRQ